MARGAMSVSLMKPKVRVSFSMSAPAARAIEGTVSPMASVAAMTAEACMKRRRLGFEAVMDVVSTRSSENKKSRHQSRPGRMAGYGSGGSFACGEAPAIGRRRCGHRPASLEKLHEACQFPVDVAKPAISKAWHFASKRQRCDQPHASAQ